MKNIITILVALLISISSFAQQGINYKAILKDTNGNVLAGTFMNVQFSIHQTTQTGTIVYQEDHNYTTDANGLVILNIGSDASPNIGVFEDIDWAADLHFLQTTITYSGGTINFDATEFMAVPYAKHANTAAIAENVFSGDYNDLTNQPTLTLSTGLEYIDETDDAIENGGWRLVGRDPNTYGTIGENAVDFSYSFSDTTFGATGNNSAALGYFTTAFGDVSTALGQGTNAIGYASTAIGFNTTASEEASTAMGYDSSALGIHSTAMGYQTEALGYGSTAMGNNTTASGGSSTAMGFITTASGDASIAMGSNTVASGDFSTAVGVFNENDINGLFMVGNGTNSSRNNALTIYGNGNAKFDGEINREATGDTNMVPIAYGSVSGTGSILGGSGNFSVTYNSGDTSYSIFVNNEPVTANNSAGIVTVNTSTFRTANTTYDGVNMIVHIFLINGNKVQSPFQFVIYKE